MEQKPTISTHKISLKSQQLLTMKMMINAQTFPLFLFNKSFIFFTSTLWLLFKTFCEFSLCLIDSRILLHLPQGDETNCVSRGLIPFCLKGKKSLKTTEKFKIQGLLWIVALANWFWIWGYEKMLGWICKFCSKQVNIIQIYSFVASQQHKNRQLQRSFRPFTIFTPPDNVCNLIS